MPRRSKQKAKSLSIWLGVFHDFIDVLDEFNCEDLQRQVVKRHGSTGKKVRRFFSSSKPLAFRFKMGHRIKEIKEKLEELAKVRAQFHLEERVDDKRIVQREMSHSFVLGIKGLGKTMLAQFTVLKLAKEILKYAGGGINENMSMDDVQSCLRSAKGSKIVVTTRSHKVATVMAHGPIQEIEGLLEVDCLSLFIKCAFIEGEEKQYPKLVEIGKQIVKKCKGVPLAVKTLGSLLYSKTEESAWISIRDNEIWKLKQKDEDILLALKLSYYHLPSYIKECFAYCSLFPKDYQYDSMDLIPSWMAHGLLFHESNKKSFPKGIQRLTALRKLDFANCESLISLPQGLKNLTTLESLEIWDYGKLDLMEGEDYPTRLQSFTIGIAGVALPQWPIRSANTLQCLKIVSCVNLAALPEWLPDLSSLQKLEIWECQKLLSLPEGMGHLTALRDLKIKYCGELSKNCEREVGVEWPKIKHNPQIVIRQ
uniref:Uncharacterized protein n=1 Tax=Fagus sylvatica TaxID=28930 RepID=A0A2N9ICN2_FAGSY